MNTKILLLLTFLGSSTILFNACNKEEPLGCFTYEVKPNFKVQFLNCSVEASHFDWNFGDGSTGTGINPTHTYSAAGTYKVALVAYFGEDGKSANFDLDVEVVAFNDPIACFDYEIKTGLRVQFLNCSEDASYFEWDFGDGSSGKGINPEHKYAAAGKYTVGLTAYIDESGTGAKYTETIEINVIDPPLACFESSALVASPGQKLKFLNCSENAGSFEWDFGDGNTSNAINAEHTFAKSGRFRVVLKAYDGSGEIFDTTSVSIKIGDKYITGITLTGYPSTNGGDDWDPEFPFPLPIPGIGVEPDIKIVYTPVGGSEKETDIAYDIENGDLPYEFDFDGDIKVKSGDWSFTAIDDDGFTGEQKMASWKGSINELGEDGIIELAIGAITLELSYEIR